MIIQTENLSKKLGKKNILTDINLTISKGEIYGLLGANGAGKTTLMKIMLGILTPDSGKMVVLDSNIQKNNKEYLKKIGSLIENPIFYQQLTVQKNLELHCDYLGGMYKEDIPKVLKLVGLSGIEDKFFKELSLGMKQRLAIGRALLCQPELLILDEPINGIDPEGIVDIRNILKDINKQKNVTIIISSHIINEVEKIADTVGIIHEGRLLEEVSKEVFQKDEFNLEQHFINLLRSKKIV